MYALTLPINPHFSVRCATKPNSYGPCLIDVVVMCRRISNLGALRPYFRPNLELLMCHDHDKTWIRHAIGIDWVS